MKKSILFFILIASLSACVFDKKSPENLAPANTKDTAHEVKNGGCRMILVDGKYHVWTKKVGNGKIKVLLLHGGPGFSHDYFECFEDFLPKEGIEFYYYDQLGCGNSDVPTDTSCWTIPRYVEEVEQVRKGLGLDNFYLLGHSWGSMLAMEYLVKYQSHVKGAVICNMTASVKSYIPYAEELKRKFLTKAEIATYDSLDRLKLFNSPEYEKLLMSKLYTHTICQMPVDKWPEPLLRAFKKVNPTIYIQMQGVDEFHVTGNFKDWDIWDRLSNIKVPTLIIGGMMDEMNPEDIKREGSLIPNSRTYLCPNGAHMSMYDDQQNYFSNLIGFLKDVDAGRFVGDKK